LRSQRRRAPRGSRATDGRPVKFRTHPPPQKQHGALDTSGIPHAAWRAVGLPVRARKTLRFGVNNGLRSRCHGAAIAEGDCQRGLLGCARCPARSGRLTDLRPTVRRQINILPTRKGFRQSMNRVEAAVRKAGGNPNRIGGSAGKGGGRFNARGRAPSCHIIPQGRPRMAARFRRTVPSTASDRQGAGRQAQSPAQAARGEDAGRASKGTTPTCAMWNGTG
jgi:hypothetical protein